MHVPYFDLAQQYRELRPEILAAFDRLCGKSSFILGEEVDAFEKEFAAYCGARHCVALNSGTSALHAALLAAGVQAGDEVITTPNTFVATVEAIAYIGARPVFVDIDPTTANIDPRRIAAAITPRTTAIVPVHLYGRPADLEPILALAEERGIPVVEDACQAHGARYRGRRVGTLGRAAAFSFYPGKNLGAYGEGGALTTDHDRVAGLARALRDHGQTTRSRHEHVGYNYRMDALQAAVLRIKLPRLEAWNAARRVLAERYRGLLAGVPVAIPHDAPRDEPACHLFVVFVDGRDAVRAALAERGVETAIHYPKPVHLQPAYRSLGLGPGAFPHAERACERVLSLPFFPEMTGAQVDYVAGMLTEILTRS